MLDAARDAPGTAGAVIRVILHSTAAGLFDTERAALADEPDGVHQHRTRVRRLRSVLAGFRDYLDDAAAEHLRVQFAEWGRELGVVRDIEVRANAAASAIDELGIDDPHLERRLVGVDRAEYRGAHARLREQHAGSRSAARMDALRRFPDDPPLSAAADAPIDTLQSVVRREARRVRRAVTRSDGSLDALHDARKAGRRLRYVVEALHEAAPDFGGDAMDALARAGEEVHDSLGTHRDELLFGDRVRRARTHAGRAGERVGNFDLLIVHAETKGREALERLPAAIARVREAVAGL